MNNEWSPSTWGRNLTRSPDWRLQFEEGALFLSVDKYTYRINAEDEHLYQLKPGTFWADLTVYPGQANETKVDGLPNSQYRSLHNLLELALADKRLREEVASLNSILQSIQRWLGHKNQIEQHATTKHRCVTHEMQAALLAIKPSIDTNAIRTRLDKPNVKQKMGQQFYAFDTGLKEIDADQQSFWQTFNAAHTDRELVACRALLDQVESKPLTEEQARAVICFDNRLQVVASAGSGKTSTMVAKAAYAIYRGLVAPENIVMMAFNKKAVDLLAELTLSN